MAAKLFAENVNPINFYMQNKSKSSQLYTSNKTIILISCNFLTIFKQENADYAVHYVNILCLNLQNLFTVAGVQNDRSACATVTIIVGLLCTRL